MTQKPHYKLSKNSLLFYFNSQNQIMILLILRVNEKALHYFCALMLVAFKCSSYFELQLSIIINNRVWTAESEKINILAPVCRS